MPWGTPVDVPAVRARVVALAEDYPADWAPAAAALDVAESTCAAH